MSVRPLIAASEYREWMQIGGANTLKPAMATRIPNLLPN
jgi:hypothetical protein